MATSAEQETAVIIVSYNNVDDTIACLESLSGLSTQPGCIIVVDNGSDFTAGRTLFAAWQALWQRKGLPCPVISDVANESASSLFLPLAENKGFAAGNNAALALLKSKRAFTYFWLLNPDTLVDSQSLRQLLIVAEEDSVIGAVGSTLLLPTQPPVLQAAAGAAFNPLLGTTKALLAGYTLDCVQECDVAAISRKLGDITGASLLVRSKMLGDVGLMDERFFLYCEETEWCLRMRKSGYKLAWAKDSIVLHREGGSSGAHRLHKPAYVDYLMLRNRILILRAHYPLALPLASFSYALVMLKRILRGQVKRIPLVCQALWHGLSGSSGKPDVQRMARYD